MPHLPRGAIVRGARQGGIHATRTRELAVAVRGAVRARLRVGWRKRRRRPRLAISWSSVRSPSCASGSIYSVEARASEIERVLPPVGGSLTPAGRQLLFDNEMVWLGVHQLIGFGEDRARIESILARLAFDEHGPYFPPGFEGHPAQVAAELSRLGVDPGERFSAGSRTVTPADLVQSARDRYDTRQRPHRPGLADRGRHLRPRSDTRPGSVCAARRTGCTATSWGACGCSGRPTT